MTGVGAQIRNAILTTLGRAVGATPGQAYPGRTNTAGVTGVVTDSAVRRVGSRLDANSRALGQARPTSKWSVAARSRGRSLADWIGTAA